MSVYTNIPGGTTTQGIYLSRAFAFTALGADSAYFWDDFVVAPGAASVVGWEHAVSGTGSVSTKANSGQAGIIIQSSGATAASFDLIQSNSPLIGPRKTTRWYTAVRQAVTTAIDAQTTSAYGLQDIAGAGQTAMVGVFGASSTANFVIQFDGNRAGTFVSTGVAIDTAFHVFEVYCLGDSIIRVRVDSGAEVTGTLANAIAGPSLLCNFVGNGTTATNRSMTTDWTLGVAGRS